MQVARKLIEQDEQRQSASRCVRPVVKRSRLGKVSRRCQAGAGGVERRVRLEPHLAMGRTVIGKPEREDVVCACHVIRWRCHAAVSAGPSLRWPEFPLAVVSAGRIGDKSTRRAV